MKQNLSVQFVVPVQGEIRHALVNIWNIDLSTSQSTPEHFHRMTSHTFFWRNPLTFLCCGRICHDVCRFHCFINTVVFYFVLSLSFFQLSTTQHLGHTPPTLVGDGNAFCLPPRVTKMWWASDFEQASNWKQISWEWFNHQKMPANMQTSEIHKRFKVIERHILKCQDSRHEDMTKSWQEITQASERPPLQTVAGLLFVCMNLNLIC